MANCPPVSFSRENLDLEEIYQFYNDVDCSVRVFFSEKSSDFDNRFSGYTKEEIVSKMQANLREHERGVAMSILAAVEAALRIDYAQRCYLKKKDDLSRAFRIIYKTKGVWARLEEDILGSWKRHSDFPPGDISKLIGAFNYRNWLAHGRYWTPKLGQTYDYNGLYMLADTIFKGLPLLKVGQ